MSDYNFGTNRRNVLKKLGLAGVGGGSTLLAADPAAAAPPSGKINDVWDAMVDLAEDLLGQALPWHDQNVSVAEKQRRFRSLFEDPGDVGSNVYIPDVLPFSACYWTDYGADGKKICFEASPVQYGKPDCWQTPPTMGYVSFSVTTFDLKIDRSWEVRKDFSLWAGLDDGCLWTGQEDFELCSEVICEDDLLDTASAVAALAEAGLRAGLEAIEEWVSKQDMVDWLYYAAAVLVGIALILALWYVGVPSIGAFALLAA